MDSVNRPTGARRGRLMVIAAALFAGLGLAIYGVDADLVNFFLPTRTVVLTCLLSSAGMLVLYLALHVRAGVHLSAEAALPLLGRPAGAQRNRRVQF